MPESTTTNFCRDHLFIEGMEVACRIGTTPEERAFPQVLRLSIRLFLPLAEAGRTDALAATVDYARIIQRVQNALSKQSFHLIETAVESVAAIGLAEPRVTAVWVSAAKKVFSGIDGVGAAIYRERKRARRVRTKRRA